MKRLNFTWQLSLALLLHFSFSATGQTAWNILSGPTSFCQGENLTLVAPAGAVGAYSWYKNGVLMHGPGFIVNSIPVRQSCTYSVTYTDPVAGVVTIGPFAFTENPKPAPPALSYLSSQVCQGQTVNVSGPAGYSYQWSRNNTAITGATSQSYNAATDGKYRLSVTDGNGCVSKPSAFVNVQINALPSTAFVVKNVYANGSMRLKAGSAMTYQWYMNGSPISAANSRYLIITQSGNYSLEVTNSKCTAMSASIPFTVNYTGLRPDPSEMQQMEEENISIFPNPSNGIFHIRAEELLHAVVRDMQGKVIADLKEAMEINLTDRAAGIYLVQLYNKTGQLVKNARLMKQ